MSVPDSLRGSSETCPACGNVGRVPDRQSVIWIARAYEAAMARALRFWAFCKRRRKLVSIIALNLLIVGGLLGWFLPDWMPRPVVRLERPAESREGLFPPRADLAKMLAKRGYYPISSRGFSDVLRGRHLTRFDYVRDVNNPEWARFSLWCPLGNTAEVIGISTEVLPSLTIRVAAAAANPLYADLAKSHRKGALPFLRGLCRIDFAAAKARKPSRSVRNGITTLETRLRSHGFIVETITEGVDTPDGHEATRMVWILKDQTWAR